MATTSNDLGDPIPFAQFLESVAPGTAKKIIDLTEVIPNGHRFQTPDLRLHCPSEDCGGVRTFSTTTRTIVQYEIQNFYHTYTCQNCKRYFKTFSLRYVQGKHSLIKYGEVPNFGPPIPARAMTLIGGDRELFLQGRRCEVQGLGIGAFTYYRRVIEDQKGRIFDEIIRVLEATDPNNSVIGQVKAAKSQQQFSTSVEAIKDALPASLQINGQNPLRLLHSALSEGVHALSDAECLALATAVRTVLFEFSDRLAQTLKDDAQLASAVSLLIKKT